MEFLAGIVFTLVLIFMSYKVLEAHERRKDRKRMPPGYKPQATRKEYTDHKQEL